MLLLLNGFTLQHKSSILEQIRTGKKLGNRSNKTIEETIYVVNITIWPALSSPYLPCDGWTLSRMFCKNGKFVLYTRILRSPCCIRYASLRPLGISLNAIPALESLASDHRLIPSR